MIRIVGIIAAAVGLVAATDSLAQCRSMRSPAEIPPGTHPVTVQWYGDGRPDLVCIARDGTNQMQVSHWMGFGVPAGYYILRTDHSLDPVFRGCAQFSTWQGVNTCMTSWPTSQVARKPAKKPK